MDPTPDDRVTNIFDSSIEARFVRIYPTAWDGYVALRFEVLGELN